MTSGPLEGAGGLALPTRLDKVPTGIAGLEITPFPPVQEVTRHADETTVRP